MAEPTRGPEPDADPDQSDTQYQLLTLLSAKTGHAVVPEDTLALLDIDSVATAEMSLEIEKLFVVRVDDEIMDAQTVGDLIAYVDERRRRRNSIRRAC